MALAWNDYSEKQTREVMDFSEKYMEFLSEGKTERRF